jgi:deoxyribose-phosphate aldolase
MDIEHNQHLEITDSQGNRIVAAHGVASNTIAALNGESLAPNRGTSLNLDWVENVRVNTSAVERRAATLVTRRTVKKDWQIAWLLRAIT